MMNFVDEILDTVELKSCTTKDRSYTETGMITDPIPVADFSDMSVEHSEAECQTEDASQLDVSFVEDNSPALIKFLQTVYPDISRQLQKNHRSHAFDGYEVNWGEASSTSQILLTLNNSALSGSLQVTSVSWNSTGSVLAVAYGRFDHGDWCTHKSALSTWNIDRRELDPNKPESTFDLTSCLMSLSFHPTLPSLLAGGSFNGEVTVWDLQKEDDQVVCSSGIGDSAHREPVSRVYWSRDDTVKGSAKARSLYNIISCSPDGKILIWSLPSRNSEELKLVKGFCILAESLPRHLRNVKTRRDSEIGVIGVSFAHDDPTTFVAATEPGGIFKCNTEHKGTPAPRTIPSPVPLCSPVQLAFSPQTGPVYTVECSPFHRHLFAAIGADQSIRLYSMLEVKPILALEPAVGFLFDFHWSPFRPLVFAVVSECGQLLVYDLRSSRVSPVLRLEACGQRKNPVYTMAFNPQQRRLVATGNADGVVNVFQLSEHLSSPMVGEDDILSGLMHDVVND